MKAHLYLIIGLMFFILMAGICSAGDTTSGYPPYTVREGTVSGGLYCDSYYYDNDQSSGPKTISKTFTLPNYTNIDWAMLHVIVYCGNMENNYPGWANTTFNNNILGNESLNVNFFKGNGNVTVVNDHTDRVTSDYFMWYDVKNLIQSDSNTAIVHTEKNGSTSSFDGRVMLITLVVAYNDSSCKNMSYWVNRGHDTDVWYAPDSYVGHTNFTANLPSSMIIDNATLTIVHRSSEDGNYTFNNNNISSGTPMNCSGTTINDVTSIFNSNGNNTLTYNRVGGYYKILLGLLTAYEQPDLIITAVNAYHYNTLNWPLLNLSNEVDITVKNTGNVTSGPFNVSLYANNIFIGKAEVSSLSPDSSEIVQVLWTPVGNDCEDGGSSITYQLKAIADCDGEVAESNENNNESSSYSETAYWDGYKADEHLNAVLHGTFQGGLYYTTGDGSYVWGGLQYGNSKVTHYNISTSIASGDEIELARLFVYYTWSRYGTTGGNGVYPQMEVKITNSTDTYTVTRAANYSDRPCPPIYYDCPYGNYVYDITDYVEGGNNFTITVKNVQSGTMFCPSAPGVVILYENNTKPEYDYWLVEGADLLQGGRREGSLRVGLNECLCNATIPGTINTGIVETATLGIVSAWGGESGSSYNSYYWFNDNLLGDMSMLGGYTWLYDETVNDIGMYAGESNDAQVGVNVSDVTGYIAVQNNKVTFGDDGDSMMAANAFLMVEYGDQSHVPGDCDGFDGITTGDGMQIFMNLTYPGDSRYLLVPENAANCDGFDGITTGDGMQIFMNLTYPGDSRYKLT